MDLYLIALEEISLQGLEGVTISELWKLFSSRQPVVKCAIDQWTKPFIWNELACSKYLQFYHVNYDGERKPDVQKKKNERTVKMPQFWISDPSTNNIGYCPSYYYRNDVSSEIKGKENGKITLAQAEERWGESLRIVSIQDLRQRTLFGPTNPPIIDDVIPVRYIVLEIIGKARWEGFMQADFQKLYGMDPRTSFHHVKSLLKLHLITKQSILLSQPINEQSKQPIPPKSTKMLHLRQYSNVYTNTIQKAATKICNILENAPDQIVERNELKRMCSDIQQFKKIRQWLFQNGYIQYIIDGEIWTANNTSTVQLTHFRASRPCYVNLLKQYVIADLDDDKDDEFLDYIENCDAIEPQLVYEESLHQQGYRVILACRENGIGMKKLAEVMCLPYAMARSMIRYYDTNKIGRIISVDHLKLKLQKIVAIQFLHQSETVQQIKSNKLKIEQHRSLTQDIKPDLKPDMSCSTITQQNLELADDIDLTRVSVKSKVSLRHLARKNYILDSLNVKSVFVGMNEMYKSLVYAEESRKSTQGTCCRKTFRKILEVLIKEEQIRKITVTIDETCIPPLTDVFYCAIHITEQSKDFTDAVETAKTKYNNLEKRREMKKAIENVEPRKGRRKSRAVDSIKEEGVVSPNRLKLKFEDTLTPPVDEALTDTDDENFAKSESLSTSYNLNSKFATFGRFQRLHVLHLYLWKLVYGTDSDVQELVAASQHADTFIDLVQSRHIWLEKVEGLPDYKEGSGWFNVGDIISLMPFEVTSRVLGIKCWSETAIKYLEDSKRKLMKMIDLPARLKYKLLVSSANKQHLDNCVDLLVLLAQMGLVAVSPNSYPKIRSEIMLFLRREASIVDTRFSEKTYCHTQLPPGLDKFPESIYHFQSLSDVEKYWNDLQFICLNTPLGLNRVQRPVKHETILNASDAALGKEGLNQVSKNHGLGRNYRSFTVLRDFQQYYEEQDFKSMKPVMFGNGLGAGGLDSIFFAHLAKNWRYGKVRAKKRRTTSTLVDTQAHKTADKTADKVTGDQSSLSFQILKDKEVVGGQKIVVKNLLVQKNKGGRGLKRKLASTTAVLTKKMKMERKKQFDKMIAKRFENVREKVRIKEIKKKAIRKGKKVLYAQNHDDIDREALKRMKGLRVSFSDREDAYILLAEIVRAMMKLADKGQPLEKEHPKVVWQEIRDLIHRDIPESRDKTWNAIERRSRYIKKYPHSLIVYKTCLAELEQNKEFINSLQCTKENWKSKLEVAFETTKESYSKHFNQQVEIDDFPTSIAKLHEQFHIEFAHKEMDEPMNTANSSVTYKSERDIRITILQDLIHNSLTAQKLTSYVPSVAFKVFDAYPPDELNEAFSYYKKNKLISRYRVDVPRRRSIPIATMTYNLSTNYYRLFEPNIPLRIFQTARCLFIQSRDGKPHTNQSKESEIMKMTSHYHNGSICLNFNELQGGHVAYLLAALANDKINLNFELPDEMTLSDEEHMRTIIEGKLNFQRVAFEQRLRRGELLAKKSDLDSIDENESIEVEETNRKLDKEVQSKCLVNKEKEQFSPIENNSKAPLLPVPSTESPITPSPQNDENSVLLAANLLLSLANSNPDNVTSHNNKSTSIAIHTNIKKKGTIIAKTSERKTVKFKAKKKILKKPEIKLSRLSNKRYGSIMNSLFDPQCNLNCTFKLFRTGKEVIKYKATSKLSTQKIFQYSTEVSKKKDSKGLIDMFKDGKLHASRTSLTMHRSLTTEKLVPTNAMNTHDALVVNPMAVLMHLKISPFTIFFRDLTKEDKVEVDGCFHDSEIGKRFRDQVHENAGWAYNSLSIEDYAEILKDNFEYQDDVIEGHVTIIKMVKLAGVFGIPLRKLKDIFSTTLPPDMLTNLHHHIQMLLNFAMVYSVGHEKELLVTPLNVSCWTFKAPQALSHFEKPSNKPKDLTKRRSSSETDIKGKEDASPSSEEHDNDNSTERDGTDVTPVLSKIDNPVSKTAESNNSASDKTLVTDKIVEIYENNTINLTNVDDKVTIGTTNNTEKDDVALNNDCDTTTDENESLKVFENTKPKPHEKFTYKTIPVRPWLKLNGELNGVLLKRFQEIVLIYIMSNPGCLEEHVIKNFSLILKPVATQSILSFLLINGVISKHYQFQRKSTLFQSRSQSSNKDCTKDNVKAYYMPAKPSLLNMMDINR